MYRARILLILPVIALAAGCSAPGSRTTMQMESSAAVKDATPATVAANAELISRLPFENREDFELARRGFIATRDDPVIRDSKGNVVWNLENFEFLTEGGDAPATVNASLWRQEQLNAIHGLFKVVDGIYQVRGFDLSNMSLVKTNSGWIVIDPLTVVETSRAAMELVNEHLGEKPIKAVIYTHSHIDHFGGVKGIVDEADVLAGKIKIIAPEGFTEHAVSENVFVGNAMSRRASFMYSPLLPWGPRGAVGAGLGLTTPLGMASLIEPTDIISETPTRMTIDGLQVVFQNAPASEAPAEIMFYFPKYRAFCAAEDLTHTFHNLYTLRGAQVRDPLLWSRYIHEAIEMFGDKTDVIFASHHWPTWGNEAVLDYVKKQRDLYKYTHDEVLRLANHGYTMTEIAEMIELPEELATEFHSRGYYGSLNHNAKAVYQKYLGWFDGNPSNLHALPPAQASVKYVEYMGGADAVIAKAREDYAAGEYRWVAQALNHVVFAEPDNQEAGYLLADALEQMGYEAESGPWRGFYLTGAMELRQGVRSDIEAISTASPDIVRSMSTEMFLDFMAVRLNGPKAAGKQITLNLDLTDAGEQYVVTVENGVLNYSKGKQAPDADATLTLSRAALDEISLGQATLDDQIAAGKATVAGREAAIGELLGLLDNFEFWFNIVTP